MSCRLGCLVHWCWRMNTPIPPHLLAKLEKFSKLATEFREESDRGCAVLVMCVLEDCLQDMIRALVPDPEAKLGRLVPGSAGAAIEVARLLGLLSPRQASSFGQLAAIRNRFAHSVMERLTFDEPSIAKMVGKIVPAVVLPSGASLNSDTPRGWYLMHAGILWILMTLRIEAIERLTAAPDFDASNGLPAPLVPTG